MAPNKKYNLLILLHYSKGFICRKKTKAANNKVEVNLLKKVWFSNKYILSYTKEVISFFYTFFLRKSKTGLYTQGFLIIVFSNVIVLLNKRNHFGIIYLFTLCSRIIPLTNEYVAIFIVGMIWKYAIFLNRIISKMLIRETTFFQSLVLSTRWNENFWRLVRPILTSNWGQSVFVYLGRTRATHIQGLCQKSYYHVQLLAIAFVQE